MTEEQASYFDRVHRWWKNVPVLVWIVVGVGVVGGALGFLGVLQQALGGLWQAEPPAPAELVRLSIGPADPRFVAGGELMNWGDGSSQALFLEFDSEPTGQLDLRALADDGGHLAVWETMNEIPLTLVVNAIYDAQPGSPTCIIEECGVEATPIAAPGPGHFLYYLTGGAEGYREDGECLLAPAGGRLPVGMWVSFDKDQDQEVRRRDKVHYLKPGEPLFLSIEVGRPKNVSPDTGGRSGAFALRAYARVRIDAQSTVVRSAQSVRVLMPWSAEQAVWIDVHDAWPEDSVEEPWNPLEDLRPQAYFVPNH